MAGMADLSTICCRGFQSGTRIHSSCCTPATSPPGLCMTRPSSCLGCCWWFWRTGHTNNSSQSCLCSLVKEMRAEKNQCPVNAEQQGRENVAKEFNLPSRNASSSSTQYDLYFSCCL